ncbi:hypothetical protein ACMD2_12067 [Ananas comosus]|uniref:Uncharacterized protein n=1 Tax=Ananas comosus TaxID=4615 RepID=A0A199US95_ANACO|nr:hypothetical protein ACMD2_12067 [Ananas comosus]
MTKSAMTTGVTEVVCLIYSCSLLVLCTIMCHNLSFHDPCLLDTHFMCVLLCSNKRKFSSANSVSQLLKRLVYLFF